MDDHTEKQAEISIAEQMNLNKIRASEEVIQFIEDGMTVGLGSGSTMYIVLKKLSKLIKKGLTFQGIPTSIRTAKLAEDFGIPLTDFSKVDEIDLAIDGADEVDQHLNLLKGHGGALVREKIVGAHAKEFIIIVDDTKLVPHLGIMPLPIEIVPFGWEATAKKLAALGCVPVLRKKGKDICITDNGNYILDCKFKQILHPKELHEEITCIPGVVETGLFINMANKVIVGGSDKITIIDKQ